MNSENKIKIKDGSIITIQQIKKEYLDKSLDLVENVFAEYHEKKIIILEKEKQ